jgi:hypothetical protein
MVKGGGKNTEHGTHLAYSSISGEPAKSTAPSPESFGFLGSGLFFFSGEENGYQQTT